MANVAISALTTVWNNVSTAYDGIKLNVTDTASAVGSNLLNLQVGGVSKLKLDKSGKLIVDQIETSSGAKYLDGGGFSGLGHIGTVVDTCLYDTSKDSDGGAWTLKCQDKSWYTEALGGDRWIGQQATIAAAWTAAGSTTGAVFQASTTAGPITVGKYYAATSASTATEVFRGVSRDFPALALIVAEATKVVIYDAAAPGCPMWMVFKAIDAGFIQLFTTESAAATSLCAVNGEVFVGGTRTANYYGFAGWSFITELVRRHDAWAGASGVYAIPMSNRNTKGLVPGEHIRTLATIPSRIVNDIAVTVLPNAPIDPATGLAVPTVICGTAGGVSVIKDNGTVVHDTYTVSTSNEAGRVMFVGAGYAYTSRLIAGTQYHYLIVRDDIPAASTSAAPSRLYRNSSSTNGTSALPIFGNTGLTAMVKGAVASASTGFSLIKENPSAPAKGMVAAITNAYNSGFQIGDSRFCGLADTVAETITSTELVSDGTFDATTLGATLIGAGGSVALVSGELELTGSGGAYPAARIVISGLQIGRSYKATIKARRGTTTSNVKFSTAYGNAETSSSSLVPLEVTFTATSTVLNVDAAISSATATGTAYFDDLSVKPVDPDRSVKNNGLSIVGSLTKTAVAAAAQLVAYSGFSASNYLEQPYSSNLDFGTGDFCYMWWELPTIVAIARYRFSRGVAGGSELLGFSTNTSGQYVYSIGATSLASTGVTQSLGNNFICFMRVSGVLQIYVNTALVFSSANTSNLTSTDATLRVGSDHRYAFAGVPLAMFRISATAPSAEQLKHIYRTELPMFQPNAQVTIAGTSTAVTAMAADDATDLLHVGTSWGRTSFKDLVRVESEATQVDSITSIDASGGVIVTGGTNLRVYQPAISLREELKRKFEARKALGKEPVFFDFDAVTSQVAFVLQAGYTVKAVYSAGALKRAGSTKDYTVATDGWKETVTFAVAPGNAVQVTIMAVRA